MLEGWIERATAASGGRDRVSAALPLLRSVQPRWEALWARFWPHEPERGVAAGREGMELLERVARGEPVEDAAVRAACAAMGEVAMQVGDSGQDLDAEDDAGFAHLFTALATAALHEALGEPHPLHTFDEVAQSAPMIPTGSFIAKATPRIGTPWTCPSYLSAQAA